MAEWRFGLSWSKYELERRLRELKKVGNNFPQTGPESQDGVNWRRYYSESIIAREESGPPRSDGPFAAAWTAIEQYQFSDPGIVRGHFDPKDPVEGRTMLLELKILGLSYLCGVRIGAVRRTETTEITDWAFRYDTLEGHIEVGSEWFTLTKRHETGEIWFRISASWRPGQFPNWWTRLGFYTFANRYQLAWHRLSYVRLREIIGAGGMNLSPVPEGAQLIHTGPEIINSKLWVLNEPSATKRVVKMSDENRPVTVTERNE